MKKLVLLAGMLAMVLVAAVPAVAQNVEPAADIEPGYEDELICLLPEGCNPGAAGIEPVYRDIEPAPKYGHAEPAPSNVDSGDCSEAIEDSVIHRASEPAAVPDDASMIPAEESGCFAIPVPAPADGSSEVYSW